MCDLSVTEDEYHFLMICPHYQKERDELNNVYREEIGEEGAESEQEKFTKIVSSKSYTMQLSLGSFLYNSIKKKRSHLQDTFTFINYKCILHSGHYL